MHPYVGLGAALEAAVVVHAGLGAGKSPGLSWGGSCAAAALVGVYGEFGVNIPDISPGGSGGIVLGGGFGCNFSAIWTF
jgi:hypothetical protein